MGDVQEQQWSSNTSTSAQPRDRRRVSPKFWESLRLIRESHLRNDSRSRSTPISVVFLLPLCFQREKCPLLDSCVMRLQNVCLQCLRHGGHNRTARLSLALQGSPALTLGLRHSSTTPSTPAQQQSIKFRRFISTTKPLQKRNKAAKAAAAKAKARNPQQPQSYLLLPSRMMLVLATMAQQINQPREMSDCACPTLQMRCDMILHRDQH